MVMAFLSLAKGCTGCGALMTIVAVIGMGVRTPHTNNDYHHQSLMPTEPFANEKRAMTMVNFSMSAKGINHTSRVTIE